MAKKLPDAFIDYFAERGSPPYAGVHFYVYNHARQEIYHEACQPKTEPDGLVAILRPGFYSSDKPPVCVKCGNGFAQ